MQIIRKWSLDATSLKMIALVAMTIDHIGLLLFPEQLIFRIIGRVSYPIFAYMIAEGCRYTRNKSRYLGMVVGIGILCSAVYYITERSLYQPILITFSLSILLIFVLDYGWKLMEKANTKRSLLVHLCFFVLAILIAYFCTDPFQIGFEIDYGFWGIMLPVFIWAAKSQGGKLIALLLGLLLVSIQNGGIQIYSVTAVSILFFYNGKRGRSTGIFFYVYYPIHLVVIYGLLSLL